MTNFPGHTQENLLGQLLRKKLDPRVEDWIEGYTSPLERDNGGQEVNGAEAAVSGLSSEELKELWNWAGPTSNGIVGPMLEEDGEFGDDFTISEREAGVENVVTGLRRKLDGESDEEDEEEDGEGDKMEDVMPSAAKSSDDEDEEGVDTSLPPVPLEKVLRFISTGAVVGTGRSNR